MIERTRAGAQCKMTDLNGTTKKRDQISKSTGLAFDWRGSGSIVSTTSNVRTQIQMNSAL